MRRVFLAAAIVFSLPLAAQTFPSKPLRVIVPQPPGGGFDTVARTLAEPLGAQLGQPVVVENRPGGGTIVGTEAVAKAEPDGHTILLGASANLVFSAGLYRTLPYDTRTDFKPLGLAGAFAYTLVARNDLPQGSFREIVEHARANPGKLTYASAGNGTGQHIAAALLFQLVGATVTHVPYKGAQAAYQDLIPGRVDVFFDASPTARGHIENGRVRAIAVSPGARLSYHPQVPTVKETGVADFEWDTWAGYFVRSNTPAPVLARLREAFARVAASPELQAQLEKRGVRPINVSGAEAEQVLARDLERWVPLIRKAGISVD
ncbi:MAG TPA: tripartite tricarboxylate transporter substrate binding protein [Burkholderiales bacterium]|nr:tripartite tricarboxylate transporter substrate binding protein [Burkholderiales bacterium]